MLIHVYLTTILSSRFNFIGPLLARRLSPKSRRFSAHISFDVKQSVSVGGGNLRSPVSPRLTSYTPYRPIGCVNLVPDHRRISHTADGLRPNRKFDLMRARVGMRFIERSLWAHDIFVIPQVARQIFRRVASERASLLGGRTVTAASNGIIKLGCPPSGANVKITTAERLAGL